MNDTEPLTRVIFRKFLDHKDTHYGDGIIALFPDEPGTNDPATCISYMHVGQHGSASMHLVYGEPRTTRAASPDEYADLKRELEKPPYEYRLKAIRRTPKDSAEIREAEIRRTRS
jgi:hypothetical protein